MNEKKEYFQRHKAIITRQRAQIEALHEENKKLSVQLRLAQGKPVTYPELMKYSDDYVM